MSAANVTQQDIENVQLNGKIEILAQEMKDFKDEMREFKTEMRDFKEEMRDRDNQRHAEISEIRNSIATMGNHVRNLAITAMIGIGAMCLTVIYSAFK